MIDKDPIVSRNLVESMGKELVRIKSERQALMQRAQAIRYFLTGARLIAPDLFPADADPTYPATNIPKAIIALLEARPEGLKMLSLRQSIAAKWPSLNLGKNGEYYYRTARRMVGDGRIRKTNSGKLKIV